MAHPRSVHCIHLHPLDPPQWAHAHQTHALVVQPNAFRGVVREFATGLGNPYRSPAATDDKPLRLGATPRFNCPRPACSVTARTLKDLPTQLRFERDTPDDVRKGYVSPDFLEWLMGYPIGWTAFGGIKSVPLTPFTGT